MLVVLVFEIRAKEPRRVIATGAGSHYNFVRGADLSQFGSFVLVVHRMISFLVRFKPNFRHARSCGSE